MKQIYIDILSLKFTETCIKTHARIVNVKPLNLAQRSDALVDHSTHSRKNPHYTTSKGQRCPEYEGSLRRTDSEFRRNGQVRTSKPNEVSNRGFGFALPIAARDVDMPNSRVKRCAQEPRRVPSPF